MEIFTASIILWPVPWIPAGWAPCNGQLLPIMQYQALFSLIGTQYGGDGIQTFALPKLAAAGLGMSYIIALDGQYPPRP